MSDKITHITSKDQHADLIQQNKGKLSVIDFHATWCGPCRMIAPVYEKLCEENPEVAFLKVDVDEVPDVAGHYNIRAMPTFIAIRDGVEVERLQGANAGGLTALVQKHKA